MNIIKRFPANQFISNIQIKSKKSTFIKIEEEKKYLKRFRVALSVTRFIIDVFRTIFNRWLRNICILPVVHRLTYILVYTWKGEHHELWVCMMFRFLEI